MRAVHPDTGITITPLSALPALDNGPEVEVVGLAQELSGNDDIGKVSFGTEGSQFQRAGIPTVVCGPGSIEQAHKPNEYVAVEQVAKCEQFMRRLMDRVCRS
jgi:acetylornithine deacetylase